MKKINNLEVVNRKQFLEEFGFKVFPVLVGTKKADTKWRSDNSYNPDITYKSYGILGGQKYKEKTVVVVDLDNHGSEEDNGILWWKNKNYTTDTFTVKTQSGGLHLYFLASDKQIDYLFELNGGERNKAGKLKISKSVDFFWNEYRYFVGPFSQGEKGVYTIINNTFPADLPEVVIEEYETFNFSNVNKSNHIASETTSSMEDYEKVVFLDALIKKNEEDALFEDREDWLEMVFALKASGFKLEDAQALTWNDSASQKDCERVWNTSNRDDVKVGSLIFKYLPDFGANKDKYIEEYFSTHSPEECFELNKEDYSINLIYLSFLSQNKKILKQFINKPSNVIKKFFGDKYYSDVANTIIKYFIKFNDIPTKENINYLYEKRALLNEKLPLELYVAIVDKLFTVDLIQYNEEMILNDMMDRLNYSLRIVKTDEINRDNELTNEEKLKALSTLKPFSIKEKKLGISLDNFEALEALYEEKEGKTISTGYPDMDLVFNGGFKASELSIFGGISGIGKTMILGNFAINSYLENKNVLYFSFEVSEEILTKRFIAGITGHSTTDVACDFDTVKKTLQKSIANLTSKFKVIEGNTSEFSPLDIRQTLEDLKDDEDFVPEIIFVDYIGIMASNNPKINPENTNKYQKSIAEDLRNIAKDYDIPVVSATQLNREAMAKQGGSLTDLGIRTNADSIGVVHTADNIILLAQTEEQKKKNEMYFKVGKNRNGSSGVNMLALINYTSMKVYSVKKVK